YSAQRLVKELAEVLFRSRAGGMIPKIILLGDDIDPANLGEVVWALATRCHPESGSALFPNEGVLPLVGYLSKEERRQQRRQKVIYNCLPPENWPAEKLQKRSCFRFSGRGEPKERVIKNWKRYESREV